MAKPYKREQPATIERRCYPMLLQRAANAEGETEPPMPRLTGYAAVFDQVTVLLPADTWYAGSPEIREVIERGAFAKSITQSDQRAVWNHNTDIVLGRRQRGTLKLWEDAKGLGNEISPPDTDLIRDMVIAPIERGDVDQMSFAFRVIRDSVLEEDNVITITLKELDLVEVSPCVIPQYTGTDIGLSARSMDRIEDLRQRHAAPPVPVEIPADHPETVVAKTTPAQEIHPAIEAAPDQMRHLDADLRLQLDRERELLAV